MRSFHTNHSFEQSMHQVPVKIGRPAPDASCSYPSNLVPPECGDHTDYTASFSESTPRKSMIRNLQHGKKFVSSQKASLLDVEQTLLLLNKKFPEGNNAPNNLNREKAHSPHLLFLHHLEEISHRTFHSCPLFGNGSESPIKIHLRNRGREFTHKLPALPLLGDPAFLGILYSGRSGVSPSRQIVDDCLTSVLQFILQVEAGTSKIDELITLIQTDQQIASLLGNTMSGTKAVRPGKQGGTRQKLYKWVNRLLQVCRPTNSIHPFGSRQIPLTG